MYFGRLPVVVQIDRNTFQTKTARGVKQDILVTGKVLIVYYILRMESTPSNTDAIVGG